MFVHPNLKLISHKNNIRLLTLSSQNIFSCFRMYIIYVIFTSCVCVKIQALGNIFLLPFVHLSGVWVGGNKLQGNKTIDAAVFGVDEQKKHTQINTISFEATASLFETANQINRQGSNSHRIANLANLTIKTPTSIYGDILLSFQSDSSVGFYNTDYFLLPRPLAGFRVTLAAAHYAGNKVREIEARKIG
jgi:hypothetical protein